MCNRLEGKVAVVTGAGNGIGRAIALLFAREGARVLVNDIRGEDAVAVANEIEAQGGEAFPLQADVGRSDDAEKMITTALETFGAIDVLVNNAGVAGEHVGPPLTGLTEEDWDSTYRVNLKAHFLTCRAVMPHMIQRKSGKIINISSTAGKTGSSTIPHYAASKAGAISFTQGLARELAPYRINVNAVCPGLIWTPLWERMAAIVAEKIQLAAGSSPRVVFDTAVQQWVPLKTEQSPRDIAFTALFLASSESDQITGQAINVDGGAEVH